MAAHSDYDRLIELSSKAYILGSVGELLGWDQQVMMPKEAIAVRVRQFGVLSQVSHELFTADEIGVLLEKAASQQLSPEQAANVREIGIDYHKAKAIPGWLVKELTESSVESEHAWEQAKAKSDFASWAPHLKKTIELLRKEAAFLDSEKDAYETLFNEFERDITLAQMQQYLDEMKAVIIPLLRRIAKAQQPDDRFVFEPVPAETQWACNREMLRIIGYDFGRGRIDASAHPFSAAYGRITTRVEKNWQEMLMSTLHEFGHADYEHHLPLEHFGTPLGQAGSMGVHESQSRLWERSIGGSLAFWRFLRPTIQRHYGIDVSAEALFLAVNKVVPGPIRVGADELTYPLHIIIRFELERELIAGTLAVEDLPAAWNRKYEEYLGVRPKTDAEGVLQDVHWTSTFGYFPTYVLGNMIAAQMLAAMRRDIPDLDDRIAAGDFAVLREWLHEKVHRHGRRYPTLELVRRATGEELGTAEYARYLTGKFSRVYALE